MSEKDIARREAELSDIRVEAVRNKQRRNTHTAVSTVDSAYEGRTKGLPKVSSRSNDFVYVNRAYVGSLNSVNEPGIHQPITGVYREQYWACSKWSFAKRGLAIAVGVLLGGVIGLAVTLILKEKSPEEIIGGIFMASAPD
uniref:Uncharacterized protein n=1 Tax=Heliothis virescens TaxID=7102 RepID=A0A2A4K7H4_HELVI